MKKQISYVDWDFTNTWIIDEGENYPIFQSVTTWTGDLTSGFWDNGTPDATKNAVIAGPYGWNGSPGFECNNLTINEGVYFGIEDNETLIVNGTLINHAGVVDYDLEKGFELWNNASLITTEPTVIGSYYDGWFERNDVFGTNSSWYFFGSPVENFPVENSFDLEDYVYEYLESQTDQSAWLDKKVGDNIEQGKGYLIKSVRVDDYDYRIYSGVFGQGEIVVPLDFTADGFNLVANPYPSWVDLSSVTANALDAASTVWIWNGVSYDVYANTFTGTTLNIPPAISFFVQAASESASITFTNQARVAAPTGKKKSEVNIFRLSSTANGFNDELKVYKSDYNASSAKLLSWHEGVPQIYFVENDNQYALHVVDGIAKETTYTVGFQCGTDGNYALNLSDMGFVTTGVYLEDLATGAMHDFALGTYNFGYTTTDETNRFVLHFSSIPTGVDGIEASVAQIYSHASVIYINLAYAEESTVTVFDLSGRKVNEINSSAKAIQINSLQEGTYIIKVTSDKGNKVEKVFVK